MTGFKKRILLFVIVPLVSCVIGGILIGFAGRRMTAEVVGVEANFYLKYYFSTMNSIFPDNGLEANRSVVLLDIHRYSSRTEVAAVLDTIYKMDPEVIAIDLHFYENISIKEEVNDSLRDVIRRIQDKLVAPVLFVPTDDRSGYKASLPYYAYDDQVTNVVYAEPVNHNLYDLYSSFALDVSAVERDDALKCHIDDATFATTVVRKYFNDPDWTTDDVYINYISKYFRQEDDVTQLSKDDVQGRIILIGDLYDTKDLYSTPFKVNGRNDSFAGVVNLAYVLSTLLSTKEYCKENTGIYRFANCAMTSLPLWMDFFIAYLFTVLYFILYHSFDLKRQAESSANKKRMYILCVPLLLIIFELLLIILSFGLTFIFNKIPDLLLFMTSILFVGVSHELLLTYKCFREDEV